MRFFKTLLLPIFTASSLHTGVPNIGVPITTVQEGPLSMDISLGYHAAGVKLSEPASWVGLGWSLNAGGVISRTIQGVKDEGTNGYYASTTPVPWPMTGTQVAQYGTTYDGEPDIFSFNVGGYAGKFFINKDKTIHLVPKQDLKITISPAGTELFGSFRIVTPDGTKYYFGSSPGDGTTNTARELSTVDDPAMLATSSWYLRRIESQDGFYSITLNYTNENYSFKTPSSCEYKFIFCLPGGSNTLSWNCSANSIDPAHFYNRVMVQGKRLSSITAGVTTVTFVPTSVGRQDMEAYPPLTTPLPSALDKIKVEQTSSYCTEFRFTYDYFTDASHNTIPEGKRLRLKELLEISCDGTTSKEPFKFTYSTATLPWRLSHMVDHWGFSNGASSNDSKTINTPSTTVISGGTTFTYGSSDRNSNETAMLEGSLTKIDYPTGGNSQFVYEANDYPTTETSNYNDYMLQVSNCTYPHVCCGTQFSESTRSFTAAELSGASYKFSLINPVCYGGTCSPQFPIQTQLEIYQMPGNIPISTSTVLNIYGSTCEDTIGGLLINLVNLQPNISYRFKVTGTNGKGNFQIYKYAQITQTINKKVGGLRIKQITSSNGVNTANDIIKTYEYRSDINPANSTGVLFYTPVYGYALASGGLQMACFRDGAITPMSGFENYHIGYSLVTELFNGNGKTKHTFYIEPMSGYGSSFPVIPEPARLQNGFETTGNTLDAGGSVVATSSSSLYNDSYVLPNGGTNNKVKAFSVSTGCPGNDPVYIFSNPYPMRTRHVRPGTVTTTVDGVTTTNTYNYESTGTYAPPIDASYSNSDGKTHKTEYKYPWNLTGFVADTLKKRNIIGSPLETIIKVNNVQVDGSRADYALFDKTTGARLTAGSSNANPYPWQFYRYEATFDANGNVVAGAVYDLQDEIVNYYGSASPGKGYPQTWQKTTGLPKPTNGIRAEDSKSALIKVLLLNIPGIPVPAYSKKQKPSTGRKVGTTTINSAA
ncbi:MAG: hypothetical protein IPJ82_22705 [Lewinellaceae bacterium]|nr:hypothetical protein [Lewinellaceae bacterium]